MTFSATNAADGVIVGGSGDGHLRVHGGAPARRPRHDVARTPDGSPDSIAPGPRRWSRPSARGGRATGVSIPNRRGGGWFGWRRFDPVSLTLERIRRQLQTLRGCSRSRAAQSTATPRAYTRPSVSASRCASASPSSTNTSHPRAARAALASAISSSRGARRRRSSPARE